MTAGPAEDTSRLLIRVPRGREAERRYILGVVLSDWLGLAWDVMAWDEPALSISLRVPEDDRRILVPDRLLSASPGDWLTSRTLPSRPLAWVDVPEAAVGGLRATPTVLPPRLPVLFGETLASGAAWEPTPDGLRLAVDVFGSAFFLLTRLEELVSVARDAHDRFPSGASLAVLERFADRPLVDEYIELLWAAIVQTWPGLRRRRPGFRLRLTHDIDNPWAAWRRPTRRVLRALGGDLVRRHDPGLAARRLRAWSDARAGRWDRDPYHTYDVLTRASERAGLRSTFYFMTAGPEGQRAPQYRITDRPFAAILRQIHERGHEIGLHASYEAYRSADALRLEREALEAACRAAGFESDPPGVRQHYLRFANPDTWRCQAAAGLAHDSSVGFADRIGFRSGTCRQHRVFDLVAGRPLDLQERPLLAMDAAMFDELRLQPSDAAASVKALVERCRATGGDAVLLVHNDRVAGSRPLAWYRELVQELVQPGQATG